MLVHAAGSTTVQPYDDDSLSPIELGASIFVDANKNMWRATEEFGLEFNDLEDGDDTVGVWDGEKFLITVRLLSLDLRVVAMLGSAECGV